MTISSKIIKWYGNKNDIFKIFNNRMKISNKKSHKNILKNNNLIEDKFIKMLKKYYPEKLTNI